MTDRRLFSRFLQEVRKYFYARNFDETFTPILVDAPGVEVHLQYFKTQFGRLKKDLFLRSSPELAMKTLIFQGEKNLFQISPCFRNGGAHSDETGPWHRPEFLMLEYYQNSVSYKEFIAGFVNLVKLLDQEFLKVFQVEVSTFSVFELFKDIAGIELIDNDPDLAKKAAAKNEISVNKDDDFETAYFKIMLDKLEPFLKKQKFAILNDYPRSQAILSKIVNQRANRFECYLNGVEICNGFDELLSASANREVIAQASSSRVALGYESLPEDKLFLETLELFEKKNPTAQICGNAVGLERLFSCLFQHKSLQSLMDLGASF